jgi:hypothetical protein
MIKEFLESLKLKDIVFFVLIIVLFCMFLKKNNKEKFSFDASTRDKFKDEVTIALGDNFTAIKNLGDLATQFTTPDSSGSSPQTKLTVDNLAVGEFNDIGTEITNIKFNVSTNTSDINLRALQTDFDSLKTKYNQLIDHIPTLIDTYFGVQHHNCTVTNFGTCFGQNREQKKNAIDTLTNLKIT